MYQLLEVVMQTSLRNHAHEIAPLDSQTVLNYANPLANFGVRKHSSFKLSASKLTFITQMTAVDVRLLPLDFTIEMRMNSRCSISTEHPRGHTRHL